MVGKKLNSDVLGNLGVAPWLPIMKGILIPPAPSIPCKHQLVNYSPNPKGNILDLLLWCLEINRYSPSKCWLVAQLVSDHTLNLMGFESLNKKHQEIPRNSRGTLQTLIGIACRFAQPPGWCLEIGSGKKTEIPSTLHQVKV